MQKKRVGLILLVSLVMAAVRTAIVTLNMEKNDYENDTYYLLNNTQSDIFTAAAVLCFLAFICIAVFIGRGKKAIPDQKNDTVSAASCMLAFVLLGTVIIFVISLVSGSETADIKSFLIVAFSVLSAIAFLLTGLRVCSVGLNAAMALFPLILTAIRVVCDFLNANAAPFASSGAYHIVSLTLLLLYFLCEGKAFLSRGSAAFYYIYGYSSVLFLLLYSVPNLFLHCFGVFNFDYTAAFSVADIVISVYICARLSSAKLEPLVIKSEGFEVIEECDLQEIAD